MQVFQTHIHRTNIYAQVLETREEVEEVVGSQGELGRLDIMGGKGEVWEGEGGG